MNIDYEAIAKKADDKTGTLGVSLAYVKAVIEAYEAQKQQKPEWVPLDLGKVQQGQEVRYGGWGASGPIEHFVCLYEGRVVTRVPESAELHQRGEPDGWLMRAPAPKTVRVQILMEAFKKELRARVAGQSPLLGCWSLVGEGDIEVRE